MKVDVALATELEVEPADPKITRLGCQPRFFEARGSTAVLVLTSRKKTGEQLITAVVAVSGATGKFSVVNRSVEPAVDEEAGKKPAEPPKP